MSDSPGPAKFAYVGCFTTTQRQARGKGIAVFRIEGDRWTQIDVCDAIPNPHYLALDRSQRFLYSAHGDSSQIGSYMRDPATGKLTFLNAQETGGDNSSTVTPDPSNRYVVLANGPGVAVFPITKDGSLAARTDLVLPTGESGPYKREQHGSHPHQAIFDPSGQFVVAPDKGLDRVHVWRFDPAQGKLLPHNIPFVRSRYGAGPRHISFHPQHSYAYLVNELDSTITAYRWDIGQGTLEPFQRVTTTPADYTGDNTGAEIAVAPSGNFVYVSNRGHDSVGVFAVDHGSGMLEAVTWQSVQGRKPRFFCVGDGGTRLYAANEDSHTIVVFRADPGTGTLAPTGDVVQTGSPSCIVFATH